jgi:small subunit ribosomal protein S8
MSGTDPIADMLTRIRNANSAQQPVVEMPGSRMKSEIAKVLKDEGYIADAVSESRGAAQRLKLYLKYAADGTPVIKGLRRESRQGLRRYVPVRDMPKVLGGMGTVVLSTSRGVMTGRQAVRNRVGGEFLCSVW